MKKHFAWLGALFCFYQLQHVVQAQRRHAFLPDYVQVQHAGSVGWLSVGTGYDLLNNRGRLGAQYGYVPARYGGPLHLVAGSFFYEPWHLNLTRKLRINPLDIGFKASYHFGDQFYTSLPSRYPENYYWWKSAIRFHLATQTGLTWQLYNPSGIRSFTGYMEFNTNELYLVSYIQNAKSLRLSEIIKAGLGVRVEF